MNRTPNFLAIVGLSLVSSLALAANGAVSSADNMAPPNRLPEAQSSNDPIPTAPAPLAHKTLKVVRQAGVGGPTAYARGGVLELGGDLSYVGANNFQQLSVTPSVGFFITDNLELSALLGVSYSDVTENEEGVARNVKKTAVTALIEPSFHLPVVDQLFAFVGLGLGVNYTKGFGTGFALAPRVGFNVMVGRSGVLTPAFNVNWSSNSALETNDGQKLVAVHTTLGASLGYSVMF